MAEVEDSAIIDVSGGQELHEMISIREICRLCANQNDKLIGIFSVDGINNDLATKMNLYLPIKVYDTDELPLQCCWQCASTVLAWHELVVTSIEADRRLRSYNFVTDKQLQNVEDCYEDDASKSQIIPEVENKEDKDNSDCEKFTDNNDEKEKKNGLLQKGYHESVDLDKKSCKLCNMSFENKVHLKRHMNTVHNLKQAKFRSKKEQRKALFQCYYCEKYFTRKFDMQKHIVNKHPDQKHTIETSNRVQNAKILDTCRIDKDISHGFKCDRCEAKFSRSQSLLRHRKIHSEEQMSMCDLCGKKFLFVTRLKLHIENVHMKLKKFSCHICDMKFKHKVNLLEHRNVHTNIRPYMCDICGRSFKQSASLSVHKMFHTNIFPYMCQYCQKKFRRKSDLKVHLWIHTGEKPHECIHCNRRFRLRQDLTRHLKVHVSCICDHCGTNFQHERFLNVHKKHCTKNE